MKQHSLAIALIGCLCSWKTQAQSFENDIAYYAATKDIPALFFEKATETIRTERSYAALEDCLKNKQRAKAVLGFTRQNRPVEVYYFPGTSNKRALIIGGMHGSELSSIELAMNIVQRLANGSRSYYDVLIIPSLFPDNAAAAQINRGTKKAVNAGRYTTGSSADPNRQMPELGKEFSEAAPFDYNGRMIEKENQYLLQLIQEYKPCRIANLHAIRDVAKAGIYADPRTDCKGRALGFETDSLLALSMANYICDNGGWVPGNQLPTSPTALYHNDPSPATAGDWQKRNLHGSVLPQDRGHGVSLGGWAATAVCDENDNLVRNAIKLITVEFPGYKASAAYRGRVEKERCRFNIQLYSAAVVSVFLSPVCEDDNPGTEQFTTFIQSPTARRPQWDTPHR